MNHYEQRCIRTANWKLILSKGGPHSLYDLENDPEEELDIFETPRDDPYKQFIRLPSFKPQIRILARLLREHAAGTGDSTGVALAEQVLRESAA